MKTHHVMCGVIAIAVVSVMAIPAIVTKRVAMIIAAPPVNVGKFESSSASESHTLEFDEYEKIELVANVDVPPGFDAEFYWVLDDAESSVYDGGKILAVWAMPGEYVATFECDMINWEARKRKRIREKFSIVVQGARPPPDPVVVDPVVPEDETTKAVVVYESSSQPVAPHATSARGKIEEAGIEYRIVDQHVKTGTGSTPKDVAPAIEAAQAEGATFPVLVILSGDKATKVIQLPLTAEEIVGEVVK